MTDAVTDAVTDAGSTATTYAGPRRILDADSHLMELADFLDDHIDAEYRDQLRRSGMEALEPVFAAAVDRADRRRSDAAAAAEAEERLLLDKGWQAMGAFDPVERSHVLDLLGFDGQLVFATFATSMFAGRDTGRHYAGAAAQNRAVAAFCENDPRLLPVGYVPLVDPARALAGGGRGHRARLRGRHGPQHRRGRPRPHPPRPRPGVGHARPGGRAVRPARRRGRPAARPGVPQQRHAGHRPPRRRREHPLQGLPRHPRLARAVPRRADLRRHLRPLPRAPGRVHRAGRRVGRVVAAPARLRPAGLPPHRGAAPQPRRPAQRVRPPPPQVHALPGRGRRLDDRAGRPRAVHVLDRLPPSRGRPRSPGQVRRDDDVGGRRRPRSASTTGTWPSCSARPPVEPAGVWPLTSCRKRCTTVPDSEAFQPGGRPRLAEGTG